MIYALQKVILYTRRTQQIFVAQCVRWLASIIGLEHGLVTQFHTAKQISENTKKGTSCPTYDLGNSVQFEEGVSPTPWDCQEDP
jgi:hypothetical protein